MKKEIILIHGLFMHPIVMKSMERRLKNKGYEVHQFSHNSTNYSDETLHDLKKLVDSINSPNLHLVGHSMGGLISRQYMQKFNDSRIQSIVTIGTPHNGSRLGKYLHQSFLKPILGSSGKSGIVEEIETWNNQIPMGCIAGVSGLGFNTFFKGLHKHEGPNDGTVFVDEAIEKNCTDSIVLNSSHTGMVYSKEVVKHCISFIENLKFPVKNKMAKPL